MTGLGSAFIAFLLLSAIGLVDSGSFVILVVLEFAALVVAGYIAGRFAPIGAAVHGGLAGLAVFSVAAVISVASAPGGNLVELLVLALVAAVLGSAGGALAERRRRT